MSNYNKLVVFDCDGTLVDSQHMIVDTMHETFDRMRVDRLPDAMVRSIVGLSLVEAIAALLPEREDRFHEHMAKEYRTLFYRRKRLYATDPDPLYEGTLDVLQQLDNAGYMLGVATGNSNRGLARVLEEHGLGHLFVSLQTADNHPSKPNPSMMHTAIAETGSHIEAAVMVGDTSFDMMMAKNAGCKSVGVAWGYHSVEDLNKAGANHVVSSFFDIPERVRELIG